MRKATPLALLAGLLPLVLCPAAGAGGVRYRQRQPPAKTTAPPLIGHTKHDHLSRGATSLDPAARRADSRPRVGEIEDLSEVSRTVSCGFYFQLPKKGEANPSRYVFISQVDGRDAWMNLDGRDTRLRLVRISPYPRERLGARRRIDYRAAGGYEVLVRTVVDAVSDENNYEPTRFRVTLTVSRGRARTVVTAVGYSGC